MQLSAFFFILSPWLVKGENWAVLVAGSKSWTNYRHQADVCHAYQVLHKVGGIPEERIIVMMADDIAWNSQNPYPGNIINVPNGENVYLGVPKDYTGTDVNKDTFIGVLLGEPSVISVHDSSKLPRVLRSTEDDNVFIFYSDHGATGFVQMPYGDPLFASELVELLGQMKKRKMFDKLVFYLEACESGSMFEGLLSEDLGVYAMTASAPDEPSFAYYWDRERLVYISDEFSVNWIVDSEANMSASGETIERQFEITRSRTFDSHVKQYGDKDLVREPIVDFEGVVNKTRSKSDTRFIARKKGISQWDVSLESLYRKFSQVTDIASQAMIQEAIDIEILRRHRIEYLFRIIVSTTVPKYSRYNDTLEFWMDIHLQPTNFTALRSVWFYSMEKCLKWSDYALQFWTVLVSLCESFGESVVVNGLRSACNEETRVAA